MQEQTESFAEYRARSGVNWSALKHYAKSPAHYLAAQANPPAQTPEMQQRLEKDSDPGLHLALP